MKLTLSLFNENDVETVINYRDSHDIEVILGCLELSTEFSYSFDKMNELAELFYSKNIPVFFQWDILMTENVFTKALETVKKVKGQLFSAFRVKDPGALYYLRENFKNTAVHYIAESGNHNKIGLVSWLSNFKNITRIILSPELSYDLIHDLRNKIDKSIELEVLGMGMVLLFYTPRSLLSPVKSLSSAFQWAQGTSEESPHKGFPLLENVHGTFMYNTKDIFIFDEYEKIEFLSQQNVRLRVGLIDCSLDQAFKMITCKSSDQLKNDKDAYPRTFIKGFFRTNKTDVLFKKLKNSRIQNRDESFLGEVVEVKKKKHVGLFIKEDRCIRQGDKLIFSTPEGKEKSMTVKDMFNGAGKSIEEAEGGQVVFFPPVGGVSVRTLVHHGRN